MKNMIRRYNMYSHAIVLVRVNRLDVSRIGNILDRASRQLPVGLFNRLVRNYID